jgi:hypothetical protein
MSNVKRDLMKEIEAKVARKKMLSKQVSRQKTVANWVAEFFTEYEKIKKMDENSAPYSISFTHLAVNKLELQLRSLDRKCYVSFRKPDDGSNPVVEIKWSQLFIQTNNCEETLVLDASSAFFQSAMEDV